MDTLHRFEKEVSALPKIDIMRFFSLKWEDQRIRLKRPLAVSIYRFPDQRCYLCYNRFTEIDIVVSGPAEYSIEFRKQLREIIEEHILNMLFFVCGLPLTREDFQQKLAPMTRWARKRIYERIADLDQMPKSNL